MVPGLGRLRASRHDEKRLYRFARGDSTRRCEVDEEGDKSTSMGEGSESMTALLKSDENFGQTAPKSQSDASLSALSISIFWARLALKRSIILGGTTP